MKFAVTVLVFCVAALLSLGMVMLYSSSMSDELHHHQVGAHYLVMQLIWCALGLVICVGAASLDYRWLKKLAWPVLIVAVVLLALVLEKHFGVVRGRRAALVQFWARSVFNLPSSQKSRSSWRWRGTEIIFNAECRRSSAAF